MKYTLAMVVGTLLGSILGIMGSFAFTLGLTETFIDNIEKRKRRKILTSGIWKFHKNISFFREDIGTKVIKLTKQTDI